MGSWMKGDRVVSAKPGKPSSPGHPELELQVVQRSRVYQDVVAHLQALISEGLLKPGDKLPSERDLAQEFQVGRSSIRDAIRILEATGVVKSRQGGGTVVQDLSVDSLVVPLTNILMRKRLHVEELMDARSMIEPSLAARAAIHASPEEIVHLEELLRRQKEKVRRGELAVDEDSDFHFTIAVAAGNKIVRHVLDVLMGLLSETRGLSLQVPGRPERSLAGHQSVLRAIKRHAPEAAAAAMRKHIESVEKIVIKKL